MSDPTRDPGSPRMALYTAKPAGGVTWVSDNALLLSGFLPEQFLGDLSFWSTRIHPDDRERVLREFAAVPAKGSATLEYRWQCAEGAYRWFLDHAMLVRDEAGKPQEIVGAWMDVTGRKRNEEELQRLNGSLSAHQAALEVCHDVLTHHVSNASMAVLTIVDRLLMGRDGALASRQEDLLLRARRQAHELNLLADTARHLARLRVTGLPEPVEPAEVAVLARRVEDKVRGLHLGRDPVVELEADCAPCLENVPLLEHLLVVLVDAAVRHGAREGRRVIRLGADRGAEGIRLRVRGGGLPDRAWLDPLLMGKTPGRPMPSASLGAALVHEWVARGGGQIETRMSDDDPEGFEVGILLPGGVSWPAS